MNSKDIWVAEYNCSEATNGIVEIVINNLNDLYDKLQTSGVDLYDPAEDILIIHCKFPETLKYHSNCEYIEQVNVSDSNQIYIKFPQYFNSYNVSVSVQGHSHTRIEINNQKAIITTFPVSKPKIVSIPSFLSYDKYTTGTIIRFQHPIKNTMINGQIDKVMNDNMYKISYTEDDLKSKQIEVPMAFVYPKPTNLLYTLKWGNDGINMNLYWYKYILCENTKTIIGSIFDFFENDRCFGNGYDTWLFNYGHYDKYYLQTISNFLTQNICDFIFETEYDYNIEYMFGKFTGKLKFDNVRKYYLTQNELVNIYCDCCGSPLNMFDFAYFLNNLTHMHNVQYRKQSHQVCIGCVCTIIDSWSELQPLLCNLLNNQLNKDCIKTIVDYTIGTVNYTKTDYSNKNHQHVEDKDGDIDMVNTVLVCVNDKKRWLTNINTTSPLIKKRRLNNQ